MPVEALARVVQELPAFADEHLIVGAEHFSDAGVYALRPDLALVQSVDFFPPIVNDPRLYGRIAAANALSDVYAMGGRPLTALNIVAFPDDELDADILLEILRGGADTVRAAGAVIVGGHTVRDPGIIYGLAVTGTVDPARLLTNAAAAPGDVLVLTKPLGTGFVTTAERARRCPPETLAAACASMTALNAAASAAAVRLGARAATDVTGFGLAGHAVEMAKASDVTIVLDHGALPLLDGALELARARHFTRANATNRAHVAPDLRVDAAVDPVRDEFLYDPQTSGGLLVALAPERAVVLVEECRANGDAVAAVVGAVRAFDGARLVTRD